MVLEVGRDLGSHLAVQCNMNASSQSCVAVNNRCAISDFCEFASLAQSLAHETYSIQGSFHFIDVRSSIPLPTDSTIRLSAAQSCIRGYLHFFDLRVPGGGTLGLYSILLVSVEEIKPASLNSSQVTALSEPACL